VHTLPHMSSLARVAAASFSSLTDVSFTSDNDGSSAEFFFIDDDDDDDTDMTETEDEMDAAAGASASVSADKNAPHTPTVSSNKFARKLAVHSIFDDSWTDTVGHQHRTEDLEEELRQLLLTFPTSDAAQRFHLDQYGAVLAEQTSANDVLL
jgi:hypothetical protein